MIKNFKKKYLILFITIIVTLLSFFLLSNSLFILSPFKNGYEEYIYKSPIKGTYNKVYIDKKIKNKLNISDLYNLFKDEEEFHKLKFIRNFDIYICINDKESKRIFPFFTTKASGFAFGGNFIILNYNNMKKLNYNLNQVIKHEASHVLIQQNMNIIDNYYFTNNNYWFREGIAVFYQEYWPLTKDELKKIVEKSTIKYDEKLSNFNLKPTNHRADFALCGYFIEYLINKYGYEKFYELINEMVTNISNGNNNFNSVYSIELEDCLNIFLLEF